MHAGDLVGDRFELAHVAGTGGMGEVWRARDRLTGSDVALKLLNLENSTSRERFAREAAVLAELSHPAIVKYVAHGATQAGVPFIAMEWLEGEDLAARLSRGPMSVTDTITLAQRVAGALATAHARGVVHRDVKPSNIILVKRAADRAKLVDFGVARPKPAERHAVVHTHTGAPVGSPGYMAPEQARGDKTVGPAADVFALGCVLYECITARPAFAGEHLMAILAKLVLEDPRRASELVPSIPAALDDLVFRMLSKDAALRPSDGAAIQAELSALDGAAPISRRSARPDALGRDEMRLVSVVIAAGDHTMATSAPTLTPEQASTTAEIQTELENLATKHGAKLVKLADGTRLAVLIGQGAATDQATRAARAAIGMAKTLARTPIAIATGRAIVQGRLPVGEAIDRAAKLVSSTPGIRMDRTTAGLLDARFELGTDGTSVRLLGERASQGEGVRTLLGRTIPCCGRDREIATLMDLFDECTEEPVARAMIVTGSPGIGKSRLRHEWLERLRDRDVEIWTAQGDPMGAGSPFALLGAMLRQAAGVALGEDPVAARTKILERVSKHVPESERTRVAEFIGEIARVPFDADESAPLRAARVDAQLMADQTLRAWLDFASAETTKPLAIVLEDIQWGDLPTMQYVDAALRRLRDAPLFVLALGRPELDQFGKLWAERGAQTLSLTELGKRASEKLVREVLGKEADASTVSRIVQQGAGHPLLLEELVRAEVEGRGGETPETVLAFVQARLETLPEPARRVLRAASIFGTSFWRGALVALLGGPQRQGDVDEWIGYLASREMISVRAQARFANETEYGFTQELVRQAAYATLLDQDRILGHTLAADWLEKAGERDAVTLAEHYEAAGAKERAATWWRRAAEAAIESSDLAAAIARCTRAIACGALGEARGEIERLQVEAQMWLGESSLVRESAAQAIEHLPPGSPSWYSVLGEFAIACERLGDRVGLDRVLSWMRNMPPREDALIAYGSAACQLAGACNYTGLWDASDEMVAIARSVLEKHPEAVLLAARIHDNRAVRATLFGNYAEALVELDASAKAYETIGDVKRATRAALNVGDAWMNLGRYEDAAKISREVMDRSERLGLDAIARMARSNLAFALARSGHLQEARAVAEKKPGLATSADVRIHAYRSIYLADILVRMGETETAERTIRAAVKALDAHKPVRGLSLGVLGTVLLARGDPHSALEATTEGMAILGELGSIGEGEAMLRLAHARALAGIGDRDGARAAILEAKSVVHAKAARIADESLRKSYLEDIDEHARTLALANEF